MEIDPLNNLEASKRLGLKHREDFYVVRRLFALKPSEIGTAQKKIKGKVVVFDGEEMEKLAIFLERCRQEGWQKVVLEGCK